MARTTRKRLGFSAKDRPPGRSRRARGKQPEAPVAAGAEGEAARIGGTRPLKTYLKEWRKYRGLTQAQVGEALGVEGPTISRIESGLIQLLEWHLVAFAQLYRCEPAELLARDPRRSEEPFWKIWDRLRSPATRQQMLAIFEAYLNNNTTTEP